MAILDCDNPERRRRHVESPDIRIANLLEYEDYYGVQLHPRDNEIWRQFREGIAQFVEKRHSNLPEAATERQSIEERPAYNNQIRRHA